MNKESIIDSEGHTMVINHLKTDIFGLKYYPSFEDFDFDKHPWYIKFGISENPNIIDFYGPYVSLYWTNQNTSKHFSECNAKTLENAIDSMGSVDSILEIGVHRPDASSDISSTKIIIDKKRKDAIYLGVDINDKSSLNDIENNVHTMVCDSLEIEKIKDKIKSLGIEKLDLIFIDGDHSIKYALNDWKFAELLRIGGKIIYHDVSAHTVPRELTKAVDTDIFRVEVFCKPNEICHDHGIGIFTRLK